ECTPWGMPAYNIFGWQRPCYLLQEGYAESYKELLETTAWENYGVASGNPKCANCMVSCGYETTAVIDGFGSVKGFLAMARGNFRLYPDRHALKLLDQVAPSGPSRLIQIAEPEQSLEETRA
ncbi:MAG: DUF3463 domain-containing protein, partial [Terracidiphilus sp.]